MRKVLIYFVLAVCLVVGGIVVGSVVLGKGVDKNNKITIENIKGDWYITGEADKKVIFSQTGSTSGGSVNGEIAGAWSISEKVLTVTLPLGAYTGTLSNEGKILLLALDSSTIVLIRKITVPILGTWEVTGTPETENLGMTYKFSGTEAGGSVIFKNISGDTVATGTWSLNDTAITLTIGSDSSTAQISFSNDSNTLTIRYNDGDTVTLVRQ